MGRINSAQSPAKKMGSLLNPSSVAISENEIAVISAPMSYSSTTPLQETGFAARAGRGESTLKNQGNNGPTAPAKIGPQRGVPNVGPISEKETEVISAPMSHSTTKTAPKLFFNEPFEIRQEAMAMASAVICHLLLWMTDGRTVEERGLRASVALYCIRPDLVNGVTLDQIGVQAGCSRQAVHKLANAFRSVMGLSS
jgi:hypothetical protein